MDCTLILFRRKVEKVIPDFEKSFLEPNWKESLKVYISNKLLVIIFIYYFDYILVDV
jgi:hypothetical protein